MAVKRKKRKMALPGPAMPFPASAFDTNWPTEDRAITMVAPAASEYKIADGTKFFIRPIVLSVRRVVKKYNELGEPLYIVNVVNSIETKAPKNLMKPRTKSSKKKRA